MLYNTHTAYTKTHHSSYLSLSKVFVESPVSPGVCPNIWYIHMRCHQMPSQDSSVLKLKCHMKLCYMPHTKVVLWYFTWFGCEQPDRRVCLALSVQEPSFRCRGLAGSSPSARLGWSRTSHRSQIPRSTPWINKDLQTFESHPRYWFSEQGCCCWGQTFQTKIKSGRKGHLGEIHTWRTPQTSRRQKHSANPLGPAIHKDIFEF